MRFIGSSLNESERLRLVMLLVDLIFPGSEAIGEHARRQLQSFLQERELSVDKIISPIKGDIGRDGE